jgi:Rieske Fe-S protein
VVYVAGRFLTPPPGPPVTVDVGSADALSDNAVRIVKVGSTDAALMRTTDGGIRAMSLRCTHAACNVNWDQGSEQFICPCHGGLFARDGSVLEGPPNEPLHDLQVEQRNGNIYVTDTIVPRKA